jgi:hypothetical protein
LSGPGGRRNPAPVELTHLGTAPVGADDRQVAELVVRLPGLSDPEPLTRMAKVVAAFR